MKKQFLIIMISLIPLCSWGITPEEIEALSLKVKVAQIGMYGFQGKAPEDEWVQEVNRAIEDGSLSNLIFYGRNIEGPDQLQTLMSYFHSLKTQFTPLFAVDQEGGKAQRLKGSQGFEDFASAQDMAEKTPEEALEYYTCMGALLKKYGFNYNLGPVVDINPDSDVYPVIGGYNRSYGIASDVVVTYGRQI
jgi:beta-glucosidase-like glycosyl hydrolase